MNVVRLVAAADVVATKIYACAPTSALILAERGIVKSVVLVVITQCAKQPAGHRATNVAGQPASAAVVETQIAVSVQGLCAEIIVGTQRQLVVLAGSG